VPSIVLSPTSLLCCVNQVKEPPGTRAASCSTRSPRRTGRTKQISLQLAFSGQKQQFVLPAAGDWVPKEKIKLNTCKCLAATGRVFLLEWLRTQSLVEKGNEFLHQWISGHALNLPGKLVFYWCLTICVGNCAFVIMAGTRRLSSCCSATRVLQEGTYLLMDSQLCFNVLLDQFIPERWKWFLTDPAFTAVLTF